MNNSLICLSPLLSALMSALSVLLALVVAAAIPMIPWNNGALSLLSFKTQQNCERLERTLANVRALTPLTINTGGYTSVLTWSQRPQQK